MRPAGNLDMKAARSTGEEEGGEEAAMDATYTDLAAKTGTEDPEGTFTSV
jgi:hypothetical protein